MNPHARTSGSLRTFLMLVFVLSAPFWLVGGNKLPLSMNLPLSALTAFVPMIAASLLSFRQQGGAGAKDLLKLAFDFKKIQQKSWYLPTLLLAPLLYIVSYVILRLTGSPIPVPTLTFPLAAALFVLFFVSSAGEEVGWMGIAIDPLQNRWGAFRAGLLLGIVWAIWHSIPFVQTHNPASWVVWQCLKTIAMRIVIVWIYNNTRKSVFAAILYHTTDDVCWSVFPNGGSYYDPFVTGTLTWLTAGIVTFAWGGKTLAQYRFDSTPFSARP
jgi:membrane protease YdiL (CAAX protease family)